MPGAAADALNAGRGVGLVTSDTQSGERLSVCLVSQEFPPHTNWGGVATANYALASGLAREGHSVTVISRSARSAPEREVISENCVVHRVDWPVARKRLTGRTIDRILFSRAVERVLRTLGPPERFDVIETMGASLEGDQPLRHPEFARRILVQVNGSNAFGQEVRGPLSFLHRLDWAWSFEREMASLQRAPRIVVASEATRTLLLNQGVDGAKIVTVYHGIDTERFHPRASTRLLGPLRVGFVGRLESRKGVDAVWRVVDRFKGSNDLIFHFVGAIHPTARHAAESFFARHPHLVRWDAALPYSSMPDFYRSLDVLLLPSRFENFGLAYAEGMATGLVVFAGRGGAGKEMVDDGRNGFLVDPDGSLDDVVERIKEIVRAPAAFDGMREAARESIVRRFSVTACLSARISMYRGLIQ